jgi:hypothetical protein
VKLTTHLQLVPRLRKGGSIHPLPHTPSAQGQLYLFYLQSRWYIYELRGFKGLIKETDPFLTHCMVLGSLFNPEAGSDMFLRNFG